MAKHIFIVAGDASGDVYGAQLVEAIRKNHPDWTFSGLGGDRMQATGMHFLYHLVREFSVMGFLPVILGMPKVMRFLEITLNYFDQNRPDIVVLIDYPGFNLYLATHTKKRNIPTVYYVTPQIWAWAPWRIKKIQRLMTKMLVIFPFEVPFYSEANVPVEYVGHPLMDRMATFTPDPAFYPDSEKNILALLPGSRRVELEGNLPVMLWGAAQLAKHSPVGPVLLALSSSKYEALVQKILADARQKMTLPEVTVLLGKTYDILHRGHMVFVTSGTATLETALFQKAMVVFYRVPKLHKWVVEHTSFLKCKYIALPNIISERKIVPEYLLTEAEPVSILEDIYALWEDTPTRAQCLLDLAAMKQKMHRPGASENTARAICDLLEG